MNIIEKLRALREKADWDDQDRLALVIGISSFMQQIYSTGVPYGAPGLPNMQSLIEVGFLGYGEQDPEYLAQSREQLLQFVEIELLPLLVKRETGYRTTSQALAEIEQPQEHWIHKGNRIADKAILALVVFMLAFGVTRRVLPLIRARMAGA